MANGEESVLLTDLYQLTMLNGYWAEGMEARATFELFVRRLGSNRNFLVAAGLEPALAFLESASFSDDELGWLRRTGLFADAFIESLADWRFCGDVTALPEGTIFFPDEPLLQVTAPIGQAQLVESRLVNLLNLHTMLASKAVRSRLAAPGKQLVDFGLRRAHGSEAGLAAARSTYIAGFSGTSTVLAGKELEIPIFGTMAHSYVEAHDDEAYAFAGFARAQRGNVVLLIDTYDTEEGARKVVDLAPELACDGIAIKAVRIDSGDLASHAFRVRAVLDAGGLDDVRIFASGSLDEYRIHSLIERGAPIDGFGVGTKVDVSDDAPYLDSAYKLTEYAGIGRRKTSEGKGTWPGRKQVLRRFDGDGRLREDVLALHDESERGEPLLRAVMKQGQRLVEAEPLEVARRRLDAQLRMLPDSFLGLEPAPPFTIKISTKLQRLTEEVDRRNEGRGVG